MLLHLRFLYLYYLKILIRGLANVMQKWWARSLSNLQAREPDAEPRGLSAAELASELRRALALPPPTVLLDVELAEPEKPEELEEPGSRGAWRVRLHESLMRNQADADFGYISLVKMVGFSESLGRVRDNKSVAPLG